MPLWYCIPSTLPSLNPHMYYFKGMEDLGLVAGKTLDMHSSGILEFNVLRNIQI